MTPDEEAWEWIERLYASASPEADRAKELLDWRDEQEDAQARLDEVEEKIGDIDEAAKSLELLAAIEEEANDHDCLKEAPGEHLNDQIAMLCENYERVESAAWDLRDLCAEAGLLAPGDYETDPLPLIRMFLPVD